MKTYKLQSPAAVVAGLLITCSAANAALLVYEGFDYTAGDIYNGSSGTQQTGGIGLESTTGWTTSGSNHPYDVVSGLSFGGLTVSGGAVRRPSYEGDAQMNRSVTANLTSSPTVWFSLLMKDTTFYDNHITASFNLAQNTFDGSSGAAAKNNQQAFTGDALGVKFMNETWNDDANDSGVDVAGIYTDGGTTSYSTTHIEGPTTSGQTTYLIVGRVDWGATDTITLYNLTTNTTWDGTNQDASYQFATMSGTLDEASLDTLVIGDAQYGTFDEIRFGEDFADVVPGLDLAIVPEPSSFALLGLGGLALTLRRRR